MPTLGMQLAASYKYVADPQVGWFYLSPQPASDPPLISEYLDPFVSVLAFGEIFESDSSNYAKEIKDIYIARGLDGVRRMNGCFSAVIVDTREKHIFVASDLIGRRSLRYFTCGEATLISNHDIPIVASGLCRPEYEIETACSIVSTDWSLQGASLLKNVQVLHPNEYLMCGPHEVRRVHKPVLNLLDRLSHQDSSYGDHVDGMVDKLQSVTRALCRNDDLIEMDLTAGLDSRAILGIALAISNASRVKAHVRGEHGSLDVSVAKRISRKYKLDCESVAPPPPTPETFLAHARLLGFFSNGDSDSKRAVHALPYVRDRNRLYLKGGGGEIFRGYYYGSKSWQDLTGLSPAQAVETILHKYSRIGSLPWSTPEFPKQVRTRIKTIINGYHSLGARGADLLDLFYLFERFGRWAALDARGTWFERHYSPFAAPELVAMGFKLPAPLGNAARLHQRIIQRHLPALYFWPINGKEYLTLLDRKSAARRYGRYACRAVDLGVQALKKWTGTNRSYKTQDQIRAEIFAGHLGEIIGDVLMVEQNFGLRVFGRQNMAKLLDEHRDGTANHLDVLGLLVTMEQWRLLVEQANRLSKQDVRDGERCFSTSDVVGISR